MPGVNGIGTNTNVISNDFENKVSNKNAIDKDTTAEQKKLTGMNNMEGVKPETAGHKAGRIIAGILGGLLLAAGIAAAAVAVTATLGVAVGVLGTVAAFAGITATSITAGAAGAAGIGLITTSALLAPKHITTSALLAPKHMEAPQEPFLDGNKTIVFNQPVTYGEEQTDKIETDLDSLGVEPDNYFLNDDDIVNNFQQATVKQCQEGYSTEINTNKYNSAQSEEIEGLYIDFTKRALIKVGVTDLKLSKSNILLVKQAIAQCVQLAKNSDAFGKYLPSYESADFQKDLLQNINNNLAKHANDDDKAALKIFVAAMTVGDLDDMFGVGNIIPLQGNNNLIQA